MCFYRLTYCSLGFSLNEENVDIYDDWEVFIDSALCFFELTDSMNYS